MSGKLFSMGLKLANMFFVQYAGLIKIIGSCSSFLCNLFLFSSTTSSWDMFLNQTKHKTLQHVKEKKFWKTSSSPAWSPEKRKKKILTFSSCIFASSWSWFSAINFSRHDFKIRLIKFLVSLDFVSCFFLLQSPHLNRYVLKFWC